MPDRSPSPPGLGRRTRRLSDRDTERRMLAAAVEMVHETGLTVSLDHLSFEDVIRAADVSRSSVYRRWPYKDLFLSDLVTELAKEATPPSIVEGELALIKEIVTERADWFDSPELRRGLTAELFRRLALFDFDVLSRSTGWRTYVALHATFLSIADGELRERVGRALAASEREHTARVAAAWQRLGRLFGFRLRADTGLTFEGLAILLDATMRGLFLMSLATPQIAAHRLQVSGFGALGVADWSLPAVGLTAVADAALELDPDVSWDDQRSAAVRREIAALTVESTRS